MAQEMMTRGGAVLLWRLGDLKFGEQSRWSRAPERKGLWAFPWPYYDEFFTYHQYKDRLPKRLKEQPGAHYPASSDWYVLRGTNDVTPAGLKLVWAEPDEYGHVPMPTGLLPNGETVLLDTRDGFWEAQRAWIDTVGKRILPLRKFWYEGDLYAHVDRNGMVGNAGTFMGETEWFRMHSSELAPAIRRARGNRYMERTEDGSVRQWWSSVDHLELFIPNRGGRIS